MIGNFRTRAPVLPDLLTASLLTDVDDDNDLDLIVGHQGSSSRDRDILLLNDGRGNFQELIDALPRIYKGTAGSTVNITTLDANNDCVVDLLTTTVDASESDFYGSAQVHLYLGIGNGDFTDATDQISGGLLQKWPEWLRTGDLNNDGYTDFLLSIDGCPDFNGCAGGRVYLNDGSGRFAVSEMEMYDLEGSYIDDRLTWESDGNTQEGPNSRRYANGVDVADVNGDGIDDIVAGGWAGPIAVSFINESSSGAMRFNTVYSILDPGDVYNNFPPGSSDEIYMRSAVLLDYNGDGLVDMVGGYGISGELDQGTQAFFLRGNGDGSFEYDGNAIVDGRPQKTVHARQWLVAELNGDGADDLFIADHGWDYVPFPGYRNHLLLSNGSGQLNDETASAMGGQPGYTHGVTSGDVNGDGWVDLFLNNAQISASGQFDAYPEARLWLSNGDGTWSPSAAL